MLCSKDTVLQKRLDEYAQHFELSGWDKTTARRQLERGAQRHRRDLLTQPRKKKQKKLAWVTTYDPRVPSKSGIIKKNIHLLYSNPENKLIFPKGMIISADRRRRNIGEMYKPSVPKRQPVAPSPPGGFFPCEGRCDTCAHSTPTTSFVSPWDGRKWNIRKHVTCRTSNVVYVLKCTLHPDELYIGSALDLRKRWANHKSDINLQKVWKCSAAQHVKDKPHPMDPSLKFIQIFGIDAVLDAGDLLQRETWWMSNVGTLFKGLNSRSDFQSLLCRRIDY